MIRSINLFKSLDLPSDEGALKELWVSRDVRTFKYSGALRGWIFPLNFVSFYSAPDEGNYFPNGRWCSIVFQSQSDHVSDAWACPKMMQR